MNRCIRLALVVACAAVPVAVPAQEIGGPWDVTFESPQGAMTIEANFTQEGESVTGSVMSPVGPLELQGTLVENALTFNYILPLQGQTLEITMKGKVSGDAMTGVVILQGIGELPWSGKRKPAPITPAAPMGVTAATPTPVPETVASPSQLGVGGKWNVIIKLPQGELTLLAALRQEGEEVSGTLTGPAGSIPVSGTMVSQIVTLAFVAKMANGDVPIVMTGELGTAGLSGTSTIGGMFETEWSGARVE